MCRKLGYPAYAYAVPVFTVDALDAELNAATASFLNATVKATLRPGAVQLNLPRVLEWFAHDFGDGRLKTVLQCVAGHLSAETDPVVKTALSTALSSLSAPSAAAPAAASAASRSAASPASTPFASTLLEAPVPVDDGEPSMAMSRPSEGWWVASAGAAAARRARRLSSPRRMSAHVSVSYTTPSFACCPLTFLDPSGNQST